MTTLRTIGLSLLFAIGVLVALVVSIYIFFRSLFRKGRAFHKWGSVCRAEITTLDETLGKRFAGAARVRFSTSTAEENSTSASIIGMAIKIEDQQDIVVATFEAFIKVNEATKNTNVADYMANQYGSVAPWRVPGLGPIWFRAIPDPASNTPKTGLRTERLEADIAADRAKFVIEARERPFADGKVITRLAELRLLERLPDDEPKFHISMFNTGRGIKPTGFRNGLRAVVYPVSQFARSLRGA
jgi:hypothetical protein